MGTTAAAVLYFILVVGFVMPSLSADKGIYPHVAFSALGNSFGEIIKNIFIHPQKTFALLYENHLSNSEANGIKAELYFTLLHSGGFALFMWVQYLIMLIPVFGQKMFNDNFLRWGVNYHYSIEFVPILTTALFLWIIDTNPINKQVKRSVLFIALTLLAAVSTVDNPVSTLYSSENKQFYKIRHYKTRYDVNHVREALKMISKDAKVSAQSTLVPHLALRDYIRLFPKIEDAEYIALLTHENTYPASKEEYNGKREKLRNSPIWKIIYDDGQVILFKKTP